MRAKLACDLWLLDDPDEGLVLVPPFVTNVRGEGAPGILTPGPLRVLKRGTLIDLPA